MFQDNKSKGLPEKSNLQAQKEGAFRSEEPLSEIEASSQALAETLASSFRIIRLIMFVLVIIFAFSGSYIVQPNQIVILLRFGKVVGTGKEAIRGPGWHWAFPAPIDEKVRIPVGESRTVTSTSGWHAITKEQEIAGIEPAPKGYLSPVTDGYVIAGDGNIMHVRARIKYRIEDPVSFYFKFVDPQMLLTNIVNEAINYAAAYVTAEEAIYKNKAKYRDLVIARVQQKVDEIGLGIILEPSDVETKPPIDVRMAFEEVISAEQERSRLISDARGYMEETLRKAEGEAQAIINQALSRSNQWVQTIRSLVESFEKILPQYEQNPHLFEARLLNSRLEQIATNIQDIFYLPELPEGVRRELRLLLNRQPQARQSQ